jgi:oxaloacetate decarboxylase alpha subunit
MMNQAEKKPVKITETILRDAHQSLIATRMSTEEMLPIMEKLDKVGYYSVECWGGATFDASLRFLKEDPWDRLRMLRKGFKNTKLQMLLRGQNILGYRHYADDVVEYFVQRSIANGIDIMRIFDAFNDLRNLETAVRTTKKEGAHAQIAVSYTLGDAYTLDYWKDLVRRIGDMGADSLCIKDMAGLLLPYAAQELVEALKQTSDIPIDVHCHCTSGVAPISYLKAIEAGCDIIDTAISPFAMGTSQPATEIMVETLKGTPYDTGLDQVLLAEIADYFRPFQEHALDTGLLNPKMMGVDIKTLLYQVPGGMLSNLVSQLAEQNASDKYYEVLASGDPFVADRGHPGALQRADRGALQDGHEGNESRTHGGLRTDCQTLRSGDTEKSHRRCNPQDIQAGRRPETGVGEAGTGDGRMETAGRRRVVLCAVPPGCVGLFQISESAAGRDRSVPGGYGERRLSGIGTIRIRRSKKNSVVQRRVKL